MSGAMMDVAVATFWLDWTTVDGKTKTGSPHSPDAERDWRTMQRYILGSRGN